MINIADKTSPSLDSPWLVRPREADNLQTHSRKFVAQVFFGNLLKQVRSSSMGMGIFDGGSGGRSFQAMLDQRIAENMSNAPAGRKIADSLVKRLTRDAADPNLPNSLEEARLHKRRANLGKSTQAFSHPAPLRMASLDTKG